jgi:hypothetical protein
VVRARTALRGATGATGATRSRRALGASGSSGGPGIRGTGSLQCSSGPPATPRHATVVQRKPGYEFPIWQNGTFFFLRSCLPLCQARIQSFSNSRDSRTRDWVPWSLDKPAVAKEWRKSVLAGSREAGGSGVVGGRDGAQRSHGSYAFQWH